MMDNKSGLAEYFGLTGGKGFPIKCQLNGESEDWNSLTDDEKNEIMEIVDKFKQYVRNIKSTVHIGRNNIIINTPIMKTGAEIGYTMIDFINDFEIAIEGPPQPLANTDRGIKIIRDYEYAITHDYMFPDGADSITQTEVGKNWLNMYKKSYPFDGDKLLHDFDRKFKDIPYCPSSLIKSELGKSILYDLKNAKFSSKNVFCHNYLCEKSFIIKGGKLIGIKNWQYAGYYPPELEDIVQKYLEYIF